MKMYRLEKDGAGPYRHKELSHLIPDNTDGDDKPLPRDDFYGEFSVYSHVYGVPERKLITHWFKGCLLPLYRHGFRVVEIDHPAVIVSRSGLQCALNKEYYEQLNKTI